MNLSQFKPFKYYSFYNYTIRERNPAVKRDSTVLIFINTTGMPHLKIYLRTYL